MMNNFQIIEHKLKLFIKKYYTNEIIRGIILFLAIGLLYFLFTAVIEHFLWLSSTGRTILFGLFVLVQAALLFKFIGIPLARLFKLFSGIDFRDASNMIGTHFPEVSDKLINILQLHKNGGDDELTWASINQKSEELKPIPFSLAIDFKKNAAYLKYLAIPLLIIAALFFTGNNDVLTESTKRVADFNNEYIPPAPFTFKLLNEDLNTLQKRDFKLNVEVSGRTIPENASIHFNNQTYYLTQDAPGRFSFVFNNPSADTPFYLKANEVRSENFELTVDAVPSINKFELLMDYPSYTGKKDEVIKSTGKCSGSTGN
ncbi:putative liver stage antigen [Nonlabens ulvanivorans]|uniref:Putative liver stage antigen n=1 Tax=Nonlabens ulvanivorans TaxID=906888 RepID=A0A090QT36_NONUL|nr:putative liver stage antigen [Nonlabens ulvanivorans]